MTRIAKMTGAVTKVVFRLSKITKFNIYFGVLRRFTEVFNDKISGIFHKFRVEFFIKKNPYLSSTLLGNCVC
jgi:hypothetical protein